MKLKKKYSLLIYNKMNAVHIIYYRMESAVILSQIGLLHWAMLDVVDETYVEKVSF